MQSIVLFLFAALVEACFGPVTQTKKAARIAGRLFYLDLGPTEPRFPSQAGNAISFVDARSKFIPTGMVKLYKFKR